MRCCAETISVQIAGFRDKGLLCGRPALGDLQVAEAALEKMLGAMSEVRSANRVVRCIENGSVIASVDKRVGYLDRRCVSRLVITIRSSVCKWVRTGGGCFMCGHDRGGTKTPYSQLQLDELVDQVRRIIGDPANADCPILCLYNGGSILAEDELPFDVVRRICASVRDARHVRLLVMESRIDAVEPVSLKALCGVLRDDQRVEVAVGLESTNDEVLRYCINKGVKLADYVAGFEALAGVCDYRLYVLQKPILLSESEALCDVLRSLQFIRDNLSPREVHIEGVTVQEGSLVRILHSCGMYELPSLWSICAAVLSNPLTVPLYVSPFKHYPNPELVPHNCRDCNERVRGAIIGEYNASLDAGVLESHQCDCMEGWSARMETVPEMTLAERLVQCVDALRRKE